MFGIGVGELFVIFIIAIVVIGPTKLPEVARTVGKFIAMAKRTSNQLREQMHAEVQKFQEMAEVKEFKESLETEMYSIHNAAETYVKSEIEEEERRLEEEARGIEQVFTTESERMFASGVPDESPAGDPLEDSAVSERGDTDGGNGGSAQQTASATHSAEVAGSVDATPAVHEPGSNGTASPEGGVAASETPAKPVS